VHTGTNTRRTRPDTGHKALCPVSMSNMPTRFLERLSPEQRGLFGFPAIGSHYWTEDTVVRLHDL
jgi:hypothetical protein